MSFLAVHPEYRRRGLASRLIETAAAQFPIGTELSVTTYREGDPLGAAVHTFYKALGFAWGDLGSDVGYPCQKMILNVPAITPIAYVEQGE